MAPQHAARMVNPTPRHSRPAQRRAGIRPHLPPPNWCLRVPLNVSARGNDVYPPACTRTCSECHARTRASGEAIGDPDPTVARASGFPLIAPLAGMTTLRSLDGGARSHRHPRGGGDPCTSQLALCASTHALSSGALSTRVHPCWSVTWVPAFAGMTFAIEAGKSKSPSPRGRRTLIRTLARVLAAPIYITPTVSRYSAGCGAVRPASAPWPVGASLPPTRRRMTT